MLSVSGTTLVLPPWTCTSFWYMRKVGWLVTTSPPGWRKAAISRPMISLEPLPKTSSVGLTSSVAASLSRR
jgi:hypothetical protein